MASKNLFIFFIIIALLAVALFIGMARSPAPVSRSPANAPIVPSIGRVQVLNGCGIPGSAERAADFLRRKNFDVKNTGNAASFKYPFTLVVSRSLDMTVARQVAAALRTDKCMLARNEDSTYDVTVILGSDFGEKIR